MKILLVNLPWIDDKEFSALRAGSRWPHLRMKKEQLPYYPFPFYLAYAAAVLKQEGHEVYVKDCIANQTDQYGTVELISGFKPDAIVIETSTPSIYNDLRWAKKIKELTKGYIILTGPHATAKPKEMLVHEYVDFVVPGEIDYSLKNLINAIAEKSDLSKVKGIVYKHKGEVKENEREMLVMKMDELPYPFRETLDMTKYIDPFCKNAPGIQMITSRGCIHKCTFCYEPQNFYGKQNFRARSAPKVVDEMEYLMKTYNVKEIYFD